MVLYISVTLGTGGLALEAGNMPELKLGHWGPWYSKMSPVSLATMVL